MKGFLAWKSKGGSGWTSLKAGITAALVGVRKHFFWSEEALFLAAAAGVGGIAGLVNVGFRQVLVWMKTLLGLERFTDMGYAANELEWIWRLVIPVAGAFLAGWVLKRLSEIKTAPNQSSGNFMEAVCAGDGRLPFQETLLRSVASVFSLSSGASIGQEGAISQLSAMLSSQLGQLIHWPPYRLRLLTACGVAGGLAAAYNAPLSGSLFAGLIVLNTFSVNLFAPLVVAAVTASMVSGMFFGWEPIYRLSLASHVQWYQLPIMIFLGIACGLVGAAFLKILKGAEWAFGRIPILPRLTLGGIAIGIISIWMPWVWGNGQGIANELLHAEWTFQALLLLLLFKTLAIGLSVGSGAVGGVFTPTLFLGVASGSLMGMACHGMGWQVDLPTSVFGLAGMGGVLAATTHSPLLAMMMVFEMSLNYQWMPALMMTCVISGLVGKALHPESIYFKGLSRLGMDYQNATGNIDGALSKTVGDYLRDPVPPVLDTTRLPEIGSRFLRSSYHFLPVINSRGILLGVIALQDLKDFLNAGEEYRMIIASEVMRPPPPWLTPRDGLVSILPRILKSEMRRIPVVNSPVERKLIGSLDRSEVLSSLAQLMASKDYENR